MSSVKTCKILMLSVIKNLLSSVRTIISLNKNVMEKIIMLEIRS